MIWRRGWTHCCRKFTTLNALHTVHTTVPVPRCYLAQEFVQAQQQQGVLVLEDFSEDGKISQISDGLSLDQVLAVVEALANLHAYSLNNQDSTKSKFSFYPRAMFHDSMTTMLTIFNIVQSMRPEFFTNERFSEISEYFRPKFAYDNVVSSHELLGLPAVIVHGDMWTNNLIFDRLLQNRLMAIIDWQLTHVGNCGEDLSRLLYTCCDSSLRSEKLEDILKFYYEKLGGYYAGTPPISFQDVRKAYDVMLPCSMRYCLAQIPGLANLIEPGPDREEKIAHLLHRAEKAVTEAIERKSEFFSNSPEPNAVARKPSRVCACQ